MDVLNKLRNTVSNTISNTVTNTAYGLSQLSTVLPGNLVTREYELTAHIASAGPGLLWKVYSGYKKSTRQEATVFVFEKRLLDRWGSKHEREAVLETLKRGVTQLTKLRHPQILIVQHPLEESRDILAFATEPVFASLANVLGRSENLPQPLPANLRDYKLLDVEIRYGLLQLGEGLAFLHSDVKLVHRNLCPESIVINGHGAWKIFGFDFCALNQSPHDKQPSWSYNDYDPTIPAIAQPDLNYQAPECIIASSTGPSSDIFSLGMLVYVLLTPGNRTLYDSRGDPSKCRRFLEDLKSSSIASKLTPLPDSIRDTVKLMLSHNPELRPDAHQFIKIEYFLDIGVKTLNYLEKLFQWDNLQKSQFYKGLPQVLKQLPHRVALHRVLPSLYKEFVNAQMVPFVVPSILQVAEDGTIEEFREYILPNLKSVLALEEPPQVSLVLMQRVDLLLKMCPADDIKSDVVPMLTRALDSNWEKLQELCLAALPSIASLIEGPSMKNAIIPRIKKICLGSQDNRSGLGVRVNCLLCLAKMLDNLDRWVVFDEILPFLQQIPHAGEPAILMAIIGIYKLMLTHSKLGMSKEILATRVLPFLLPLCVEQSLSPSQFEALASLVSDMINRVTTEHREALHQLDAVRREAQQLDDAVAQVGNQTNVNVDLNDSLSGLELNKPYVTTPKSINNGKALSLGDKQRLAQQQEVQQRLQSQSPLTPGKISMSSPPEPKDLTKTLMQNNLKQLNLSASKPKAAQPNYTPFQTSTWKNTNTDQIQWNSGSIAVSSHGISNSIQNRSMHDMNSPIEWKSPQTLPNWNQMKPQSNANQNWSGMMNSRTDTQWRPDTNLMGMSQPLVIQNNASVEAKSPLSNQDIMDLLS
ncbi:SCY1-like protein 2 [Orussus abietinus]|uniref:SCY1-like protein 2 n=1 Tax=Orussus abietinus TaxID=222816 RepID=UPI0006265755|nr:SCY1-like protein 2 [Orussus abietinus]